MCQTGKMTHLILTNFCCFSVHARDAAIALAYHVAGSMDGFAFLMNNKAKDLGMNNTSFVNSSGLEDGDNANMSTVYDMALLSSYEINN